ncbi:MAG TPA: DUF4136 domain-containing protein [Gemmatimonadaceae bacterium]|nr:DUF4136 domain-containing protein [Gemmatimonadaceae bacterium]
MKTGPGQSPMRCLRAAILMWVVVGCSEKVAVASAHADDAKLSTYHTFAMMTVPSRAAAIDSASAGDTAVRSGGVVDSSGVGATSGAQMDPMLASSPVGEAIRSDIVHSFAGRGYRESSAPNFLVAFYAGTGDIVDVKAYPYGYSGLSNSGKVDVRDYPAGTVIVDVVDANTKKLVWRGQGVSKIPNDPGLYAHQLAVAVRDIIAQFPKAANPTG